MADIFEKEDEERGLDSSDDDNSSESDAEKKWDCATILSTYTNTDNHPAVVKTQGRVVRTKQRIELHKQFKVPLDGLMAEEIDTMMTAAAGKKKSAMKKRDNNNASGSGNGPYQIAE